MHQHPIGTTPHPGTRLDGSLFGPQNRCFACSPDHPTGLRLKFHVEGDEVVTNFTPARSHEGAPGVMHGGLVTTVADEVGVWALIALLGKFGFTGTMNTRFPRPVRVEREVQGRAKITSKSTRIVHAQIRMVQDGADCFTSTMSFILLNQKGAETMLGGPLPEGWKKYFR
ncbi:PaaI family thioesterase [Pendulispora brunnea]|uniref:Acyl-coenzyme A thioesterase THEM4 n=1 Tax=Pendulispora brunnea TaxID=2905690 RepID=A0ABZ2JVM2_9BACT